ncbi:gas vesicle protein [Halorubrum sp. RMP-47]|uniref:Gas vesicle protein n=1 Tax=Halorubrum miltondacostae TaxID=3076378 RepID=A0ABD5M9C1_9EURY
MSDAKPTRSQGDLAELLETLLDKGVVINADIAVTVGDTELLGIKLRAALASFETAAQYGLEFPSGTDMEMVNEEAGVTPATTGGETTRASDRPTPPEAEKESRQAATEHESVNAGEHTE